jgi:hypothetical protein
MLVVPVFSFCTVYVKFLTNIFKEFVLQNTTKPEKKEKREPPKYPCHMCNIPVMFALTALRRHLARKHSTNFKCEKEGCNKTFAKQYQVRACELSVETHLAR